ncbi:hypothetical protein HFP89_11940 [Wenzhouxiangella sp. XN79A]|nr:hypothetical protein [Wenzhouxiangella sp. XN79A]
MSTGTWEGALTGAFTGAVTFGVGRGLKASGHFKAASGGLNATGRAISAASTGVASGVASELQGGKFGHGFASSAVSFAAGEGAIALDSSAFEQFTIEVIAGGTASEITGGKFANGALTAALQSSVRLGLTQTRALSSQEVVDGALANTAYGGALPEGYEYALPWSKDRDTELEFALAVNSETGDSVYIFSGTNEMNDWPHNFAQGLGKHSSQYQHALDIGSNAQPGTRFVGQSLGGGLAAAAALAAGGRATIFNAAGVHPKTISSVPLAKVSSAQITHIYSTYDVLQPVNILTAGRIYGEQVRVGAAGWHPMGQMCKAIGC